MKNNTLDLVYCGMFAVLLAICSWISIPSVVPFTLQTFAVFFTLLLLGGRRGTITIIVYLLLGAVGVPVFANFGAGIGYLLGSTGGYIIGFLFTALIMWAFEDFSGKKPLLQILSMILGLFICYAFGTLWYMQFYTRSGDAVTLATVLGWCVFPFIIPDLCKMAFAWFLAKRLKKATGIS